MTNKRILNLNHTALKMNNTLHLFNTVNCLYASIIVLLTYYETEIYFILNCLHDILERRIKK